MSTEATKVDVLAVLKDAIKRTSPNTHFNERADLWAAHDAIADLIKAANRVAIASSRGDDHRPGTIRNVDLDELRAVISRLEVSHG